MSFDQDDFDEDLHLLMDKPSRFEIIAIAGIMDSMIMGSIIPTLYEILNDPYTPEEEVASISEWLGSLPTQDYFNGMYQAYWALYRVWVDINKPEASNTYELPVQRAILMDHMYGVIMHYLKSQDEEVYPLGMDQEEKEKKEKMFEEVIVPHWLYHEREKLVKIVKLED